MVSLHLETVLKKEKVHKPPELLFCLFVCLFVWRFNFMALKVTLCPWNSCYYSFKVWGIRLDFLGSWAYHEPGGEVLNVWTSGLTVLSLAFIQIILISVKASVSLVRINICIYWKLTAKNGHVRLLAACHGWYFWLLPRLEIQSIASHPQTLQLLLIHSNFFLFPFPPTSSLQKAGKQIINCG